MVKVNTTIDIDGIEYDVSFYATKIDIGNDGIGGYEFWGSKGFDRGHDYIEDFTIVNMKVRDEAGNLLELGKDVLYKIERLIEQDDTVYEKIGEVYLAHWEPDI